MDQGLAFIIGLLVLAAAAGALGAMLGIAHGIESERKLMLRVPKPKETLEEAEDAGLINDAG